MKKIFIIALALIFSLSSMSFASNNVKKTPQRMTSLQGTVLTDSKNVKLKTASAIYILIGQIKELKNKKGHEVLVKGYMTNKKFNVQAYSEVLKPGSKAGKPSPKKAPTPNNVEIITLNGILSESNIEGLHYELDVNGVTYILIGSDENFTKYIGKKITVTGYVLADQVSIYQRGILFSVNTVNEDTANDTENIKTLVGTVVIDKITGAHIGFKVGDELYGLTGNVDGLESLDGKKVEITGYAPNIVYIRKPDFIIFNVNTFKIIE